MRGFEDRFYEREFLQLCSLYANTSFHSIYRNQFNHSETSSLFLPFFAILETFSLLFYIFQDLLEEADRLKKQGNSLFEKKRIDEALSCYLDAVSILPTRPQPPQEDEDGSINEEEEASSKVDVKGKGKAKEEEEEIVEEIKGEEFKKLEIKEDEDLEIQCRKARAVLYSNLAACYLNLVSRI